MYYPNGLVLMMKVKVEQMIIEEDHNVHVLKDKLIVIVYPSNWKTLSTYSCTYSWKLVQIMIIKVYKLG